MAKRSNAQFWRSGTVLMALLAGCASSSPNVAPVMKSPYRVLPHGLMVNADNVGSQQQMGEAQQQDGQQACPAPQQQSTGQDMSAGGMASGGGQMREGDKEKKEKKE